MRRRGAGLALAGALLAGALAGCTDDGDRDAYCDRIASVPDVEQILASLDASDPGGLESRVEAALDQFRALEAEAPGRIKADVARLRRGVELVLEAVRDNPGDLPGARQDILARSDELSGLASAGTRVASDAQAECDLDLDEELGPTGSGSTPSSAPTSDGDPAPDDSTTTGG